MKADLRRSRLFVRIVECGFVMLIGVSGVSVAAENLFTDNVRISKAFQPTLFLEQPGSHTWSVVNTNGYFEVKDKDGNNRLYLADDSTTEIGTSIDGRFFIQNDFAATASLYTPGGGMIANQQWDLTGTHLNFYLKDTTANSVPITVETGTPTNTLYLAENGSVGMGTSTPNNIGSKFTTGRFINVNADSGFARFVLQGASGAELNIVHNGAAADQRNLRIRSANGFAAFNIMKDDLSNNAVANAIAIRMSDGNIGLRVANPTNPLQLASGAKCTSGGVWTNASSRELKQDIEPLTSEQARQTVQKLQPVGYRYKNEQDEHYVGFIAEDVPDLVAANDRKSLAPMDIVAVLTKVVQDQDQLNERQQQTIEQQQRTLTEQERLLARQQETLAAQQSALAALTKRLAELEQNSAK